jgi:uncharacterized protein (TIRG00374 family)
MAKKYLIGIIFSSFFLYLAFKDVDFDILFESFKTTNYFLFLFSVLFLFVSFWIRAWRWRYLMIPVKDTTIKKLFAPMMIGYMANSILPLRIGELVRAYAVGRQEDISNSASFATIVVERILDMISMLVVLGIVLIFYPFPDWVKKGGYLVLILNLIVMVFIIFAINKTDMLLKFISKITLFVPQKVSQSFQSMVQSFVDGLMVLKKAEHYLIIIFFSFLLWITYIAMIFPAFLAYGFELPFVAYLVILVMVNFALLIPSAPGQLGPTQYAFVLGLGLFNVQESLALSCSLILHIVQIVSIMIVGLYYFNKANFKFSEVK